MTAALLATRCGLWEDDFGAAWRGYAARFVERGRVVDRDNDGVSHSEGQGYGMLFAVAAGDREAFRRLWTWTERVLQREDGLFSWRFRPCPAMDRACIDDPNNASDGDLLIAWALLRAAQRWQEPTLAARARAIAETMLDALVREDHGYLFLLPGLEGFEARRGEEKVYRLNLSYYVFPAFRDLAALSGDPRWQRLIEDGERLLRRARFGEPALHPDWFLLGPAGPSISGQTVYGYNACRIPLHVVWDPALKPDPLLPYLSFWSGDRPRPATVTLSSGETAAYGWNRGMARIAATVRWRLGQGSEPAVLDAAPLRAAEGYYSASLLLLSELARRELSP